MRLFSVSIAVAAALALAAVGFLRGTYAAGGSDSSCYALMAEAFASGGLQPTSSLVGQVPWPDAARTFTPGGFVPSQTKPTGFAPVCAPGFSLLLAPSIALGGRDAMFWVTPFAGALLVWCAFLAAGHLAGPVAGAVASVLIAASPPVLYQVVQPMNDVTTAALWMGVFVALLKRKWASAGVFCGLALLVRPNLLPLALVSGLFILLIATHKPLTPGVARVGKFCFAALPFALLILWLNNELYGSAFKTGYGQLDRLFAFSNVSTNATRYVGWLVETHTPFPLLAALAPFAIDRNKRGDVMLAIGVIGATGFTYFFYTPFDDWSYLRFLLPAISLMIVLASAVAVNLCMRLGKRAGLFVIAGATVILAMLYADIAQERHALALQFLEQRYRSAGIVVRDHLPDGAVVLSVWDSGAVRFHGRKEALAWDGLDPAWLDRSLDWLAEHDRRPYIMVESWEEAAFRSRFANESDIGKLDWPPKYEVDRVVRIYDPTDRAAYHRRERVDTEFLWPLRR
jgi:hypothetical protein